jgi:EmrB/QacA subfamily drug resistance transporter
VSETVVAKAPRAAGGGFSSKTWVLVAAVLGSSIVFLDGTVVNVALPRIGRDLPRAFVGVLEGQSYVYNGYLLSLCALLILAGALNDFYGRKRMFIVGLVGFGISSLLCGLAPNMEMLILFRVLQGALGALLVPGSLSLITANFSGVEQGRAFGIWAGASAGTTLFGPFLGGFLVDAVSWRAAFLINVPLIAVAIWATFVHVPESRDELASPHFDWLGAAIVALAVGGLTFGAIFGQQRDWRDPIAFVALGIGFVALIAFPFQMRRAHNPLVPLDMFKSRNFTVTNLSTFVIYGALYVAFYYMPLLSQGTLGYTAAAAGLAFVPGTLFMVLFSRRFGSLAARYGPRWFMAVGPAVMALSLLWLARIPPTSPAWRLRLGDPSTYLPPAGYFVDFFPAAVLLGVGLMMLVAPLTMALMTSVPVRNSGLASAINNAISRVGPQLAGALIFIAITGSFYAGLSSRGFDMSSSDARSKISPLNQPAGVSQRETEAARQASTDAFHLAMLVAAALLATGAVINGVGIRQEQATGPSTAAAAPETAA